MTVANGLDDRIESSEEMRVAIGTYKPVTEDFLRFASQLGVLDVLVTPHRHEGFESALPLGTAWSADELDGLRRRANDAGLRLYGVEKLPIPLYEILLNDGDRQAQLDVITETIRNMGAAGIRVLGYSGHPPDGAVRTIREYPVRGDAKASAFDIDDIETVSRSEIQRDITEAEMWDRYEEFLEKVIPVAEEAGVKLGVHPSDPPVEELFGIPLLFRNAESFERALEIRPSDNHGLKLCLGCWSEMGEDIPEVIRRFGDEIVYVHFRDVVGTVPRFHETFVDDADGNFDEYEVMRALDEVGFTGVMTPDHVPLMEGETDWEFGSTLGRSYTVGYLKGMCKSFR
ncbi:mannonate dehydratase (plasmid) [Natrinema zhouii]|uniref:mannonate dehydratase n=1 Tax=Natrinema zhouii TaxID=1710539 RepID=UPI001CFF761A|nr:mannonate dehydratase [Natrinema zhouii]UHQ98516.1 mannonate dehydratase [Natrinema zhouii]